jgi:coproporphyrinogen III oxidase-like Fe-S oxidoreductase
VDACVDELVAAGLLDELDDRVVLTRRGRLLANDVVARVLVALDEGPERRTRRATASAGTR